MFNHPLLTEQLEKLRIENRIAGMSVAVTDGDKVIYNQGFGFENAIRPEVKTYPDALYKIASMTKTVTAVMILCLCQEGILDLDKPIKTYLSWLTLSRPGAADTITLRDLLMHTAGMPGDTFLEEGSRDENTMDEQIMLQLPTFEISALPEERKFCYSSWGYNLIGCVASAATGRPYTELMREYVLKPLGMDTSTFDYQVASTYPLSLPHRCNADGSFRVLHQQRINTAYHAGAGLYSNTTDMCKFARFLLRGGVSDDGKRILSEKFVADMLSKHNEFVGKHGVYYGLGAFVCPYADRYIYGHTGNYDPYNSSIFVDKKTNCGVVFLANSHVMELRYEISGIIFSMMEQK